MFSRVPTQETSTPPVQTLMWHHVEIHFCLVFTLHFLILHLSNSFLCFPYDGFRKKLSSFNIKVVLIYIFIFTMHQMFRIFLFSLTVISAIFRDLINCPLLCSLCIQMFLSGGGGAQKQSQKESEYVDLDSLRGQMSANIFLGLLIAPPSGKKK